MSTVRVAIDEIKPGVACGSDICDEDGCVLLGKGVRLTEQFLNSLVARDIHHLYVSPSELASLTGAKKTAQRTRRLPQTRAEKRANRSRESYSVERGKRFEKNVKTTLKLIDRLSDSVLDLTPDALDELTEIPDQFAQMLTEDADQSLAAADPGKRASNRLAERCSQMSMLATATAIELEMPDRDIFLVGCAGLLHDIGLFVMPDRLHDSTRELSSDQLQLYKKHPQVSVDFLSEFRKVPEEVRILIMQVHEMPDGSGFPRGYRGHRLHRLTRILNVVEIYLALTQPNFHRPGYVPHDALGLMLHHCPSGYLNSEVMRAFINHLTLFPIGSAVQLNDGQQAQVVRREADEYDQPVVCPLTGQPRLRSGPGASEFIPLAESNLSIATAIPIDESQTRLSKEEMSTLRIPDLILG